MTASRYATHKFDTSGITGSTDTLSGNITSAQTSITLASGTATVNGTVISIASEHLYIQSGGGTATLTVVRGWAGTTATSATSGATVNVPGALTLNLLQISAVPNQAFIFAKQSTDINYVKLMPFAGDSFPGSAALIILPDSSSNAGTVNLKAPGVGSIWIVSAGAGATGAGGGGGGGSVAGSDKQIQYNKAGVFGADGGLKYDYGIQSVIVTGGTSTNGAQFVADTSGASQQSSIIFNDQGTKKWQLGRDTGGDFFLSDLTASTDIITILTGGAFSLFPAANFNIFANGNILLDAQGGTIFTSGIIHPIANLTDDLGTSSLFYNNGYIGSVITEAVTIVFGGANKASIGWNNTTSALSITNNVAAVLFEFSVGGLNTSYANLVPNATNTHDLGSASEYWNNLYVSTIVGPSGGILHLTGNLIVSADLAANAMGVTTLLIVSGATSTAELLVGAGGIGSDLIPNVNTTYNLGSSASLYWGAAYINNIFAFTNITLQTGSLIFGSTTVINSSMQWQGAIIDAAHGGTGNASYNVGDILYASGSTTLTRMTIGANATVLTSNGTTPFWSAGAWTTSFVPTVTNLTSVSTKVCAYYQIGQTVVFSIEVSGVTNGSQPSFSLPLSANGFVAYVCPALISNQSGYGAILGSVVLIGQYNGAAWPSGSSVTITVSGVYWT